MLICSIWVSAPSFWMGGGLESRCVCRVCGADCGSVRFYYVIICRRESYVITFPQNTQMIIGTVLIVKCQPAILNILLLFLTFSVLKITTHEYFYNFADFVRLNVGCCHVTPLSPLDTHVAFLSHNFKEC